MLPTEEQLMAVFNDQWKSWKQSFSESYPCTLATWDIRARLERLDGNPQFACADIRKTLAELVKEGVIYKHWTSRRGNTVWAYKGE